jgi:hypothetical protein
MVTLITNRYADRGVPYGARGAILEVYGDDAYEVEFVDDAGSPIDWFAVQQDEVKPYEGAP